MLPLSLHKKWFIVFFVKCFEAQRLIVITSNAINLFQLISHLHSYRMR